MNASQWSDILTLSSQNLFLRYLLIFVVLPCLCPPSLGTEKLHWVLCALNYHCHLAGRKCLPCCGCYMILKLNYAYREECRLPTAKCSFFQWLLGQLNALSGLPLCNPSRDQDGDTKVKKDAGSDTTGGGTGTYGSRCQFSEIIHR